MFNFETTINQLIKEAMQKGEDTLVSFLMITVFENLNLEQLRGSSTTKIMLNLVMSFTHILYMWKGKFKGRLIKT